MEQIGHLEGRTPEHPQQSFPWEKKKKGPTSFGDGFLSLNTLFGKEKSLLSLHLVHKPKMNFLRLGKENAINDLSMLQK